MSQLHLVDVMTDRQFGSVYARQLWIAAGILDDAVDIVLAKIPESWSARLSKLKPSATQMQSVRLDVGDARELSY